MTGAENYSICLQAFSVALEDGEETRPFLPTGRASLTSPPAAKPDAGAPGLEGRRDAKGDPAADGSTSDDTPDEALAYRPHKADHSKLGTERKDVSEFSNKSGCLHSGSRVRRVYMFDWLTDEILWEALEAAGQRVDEVVNRLIQNEQDFASATSSGSVEVNCNPPSESSGKNILLSSDEQFPALGDLRDVNREGAETDWRHLLAFQHELTSGVSASVKHWRPVNCAPAPQAEPAHSDSLSTATGATARRRSKSPIESRGEAKEEEAMEKHLQMSLDFAEMLALKRLRACFPSVDPRTTREVFARNGRSFARSIDELTSGPLAAAFVPEAAHSDVLHTPTPHERLSAFAERVSYLAHAREVAGAARAAAPSASRLEPALRSLLDAELGPWLFSTTDGARADDRRSRDSDDASILRGAAEADFARRNTCLRAAAEAFVRNDGGAAQRLAAQGRAFQVSADRDRLRAMCACVRAHNPVRGELVGSRHSRPSRAAVCDARLDLHGLQVGESVNLLIWLLERWENAQASASVHQELFLTLVTGWGRHSKDKARLRPALAAFCKAQGLLFTQPDEATLKLHVP